MPITTHIENRIAEIVFDVPPVNAFDSDTWLSLPAMISAAASSRWLCPSASALGAYTSAVSNQVTPLASAARKTETAASLASSLAALPCPASVDSRMHPRAIGRALMPATVARKSVGSPPRTAANFLRLAHGQRRSAPSRERAASAERPGATERRTRAEPRESRGAPAARTA